jgi:hypothetical protein
MSTGGFDSSPTPSKDMSKVVEPTNNIYALINGAIPMPNIELIKCNSQAFKQLWVYGFCYINMQWMDHGGW